VVRPLISAHRGGGDAFRAETYAAFEAAASSGVDLVEFDVRRLGDGTLVVFHDDRDLPSLRYEGLCALAGYEVPLAQRVMELIAGRATGHVDLKATGYEIPAVELAVEVFGPGGFVVSTMEDASARLIHGTFPEVATVLSLGRGPGDVPLRRLPGAIVGDLFPARRIRACGAAGVAISRDLAPWGVLRRCHDLGIMTMVWTVDRVDQLDRALADPRVDVVVTNRPLLALRRRELSPRC